jgi:hypothetical protein
LKCLKCLKLILFLLIEEKVCYRKMLLKILFTLFLLKNCTEAIYNGRVAEPNQFPWAVQIYPSGCSASIVHTKGWVFSAAHCIVVPIPGKVCRSLNNILLRDEADRRNCEHFTPQNVFFNPQWDANWRDDRFRNIVAVDLVIVRLNRDFDNLFGFSPVPFIRDRNYQPRGNVVIAGFGQVFPMMRTKVLRWENFQIYLAPYPNATLLFNPVTTIMAGDSGSGVVETIGNTRLYIAMAGNRAANGLAVLGTSILPQLDWIESIMGLPSLPSSPPQTLPPLLPPPPAQPPTGGCPVPVCSVTSTAFYPHTRPHQYWRCSHGRAIQRSCGNNGFFNNPAGCVAVVSGRHACTVW